MLDPRKEQVMSLLSRYWGFNTLRGVQEDAILSILAGHDTLVLMPTGGGKSICYQIPAMIMEGITLVVSPLIALMQDQVQSLNNKGISAVALHSALSYKEIDIILDNAVYGAYKLLYLSPERIKSGIFQARLSKMKVNLIAIDEAHCISTWGHGFRPAYRLISSLRELLPKVPVIALTATATAITAEDICKSLAFKQGFKVWTTSYDRKNVIYGIVDTEDKDSKLASVLSKVSASALVYVNTRAEANRISRYLQAHDIQASPFHAGMDYQSRQKVSNSWLDNPNRVMVCTNAFGMGIDKSDVRVVIHYHAPQSLEALFQESGRVGRDGKKSYALLLTNHSDRLIDRGKLEEKHPTKEVLKAMYNALGSYLQLPLGDDDSSIAFDYTQFAKHFKFSPALVYRSLQVLERLGCLHLSEGFYQASRLHVLAGRAQLYTYGVKHPEDEGLVSALLRTHSGILDGFVSIAEDHLGRIVGKDSLWVSVRLKTMARLGLVQYEPASDLPTVSFVGGRRAVKALSFPQSDLLDGKLRDEKMLDAVHAYCTSTHCRTATLLAYLGEQSMPPCMHCDICLARNVRETLSDKIVDQTMITKVTFQEGQSIKNNLINGQNPQAQVKSIRRLTDLGVLTMSPSLRLWKH